MRSRQPLWLIGGLLLLLIAAWFLVSLVGPLAAAEWTSWRGPNQNGVSPDTGLPASWSDDPKAPENFLWKAPYGCRSTPIVMNNRVYINNQVGEGANEQERVMCLNAADGKVVWEKKFNVFHTDIVSVRLGWTNLVGDPATGHVYWHGTQGNFVCFDKDGSIVWQRQLVELDGRVSGYGGRLPSPALADNLIVIGMINSSWGDQAKGGNRFLAMNKYNGTPVWWSETSSRPGTYFSTPTVATIDGERLLISGGSDGAIHALQVGTGKHLWSHVFCKGAINCSPAVDGTLVYANHGEENPGTNVLGRVICVDAGAVTKGQPKVVWDVPGVKAKYTSPLVQDGRVYISDDVARLWCFDARTGDKIWEHAYGRNAMGSPVWGDGKIYVTDKNAKFHILQPGPKKCKHLDEHFFPSPDGVSDVELYSNVAIAYGRVFFSSTEGVYCIGTKDAKSANTEAKPGDLKKGKAAQLTIYPCDLILAPGGDAKLAVKVYDEFGNYLEDAKAADVKWSLPQPPAPPGGKSAPPALQADFTAPGALVIRKAPPGQGGYVEAEWKGLKAKARVRVVSPLPYTQDFEKVPEGAVPAGWVNCQGKFLVKALKDGNHVLAKVTTNAAAPIASGSCFFGLPSSTNYTIEADVLGGIANKEMPDVGVGACRYTLMLSGQTQTLRLLSWEGAQRVDESIGFRWTPDKWYRLKLTAVVQDGKTTLRAKAWPKGEKEPDKWTLEYSDPTPNLEGAPYLYGYVLGHRGSEPGTEVWYDNVSVTPNKK
jgi:outer membrane protein assembly factor BamB